jgi:hypothetical protein
MGWNKKFPYLMKGKCGAFTTLGVAVSSTGDVIVAERKPQDSNI